MYDKKGRKSYRRNFMQRQKDAQEREKIRIAAVLEKKRWIAERRKDLKVPQGGIFQARKPTHDAPTQAEQDREKEEKGKGLLTPVYSHWSNQQ